MADEKKTMNHYTPGGWVEVTGDQVSTWADEKDYDKVVAHFAKGYAGHEHASPAYLLANVVYSLTWDLEDAAANIEGIYCDQWCGVRAKGARINVNKGTIVQMADGTDDAVTLWIQCDRPEWGVAKAWLLLVEKYGLSKDQEDTPL